MNENQRGALTAAEQDRIEQKLNEIIETKFAIDDTINSMDVAHELAKYIGTFGLPPARALLTAKAFVEASDRATLEEPDRSLRYPAETDPDCAGVGDFWIPAT
jgi:hypothetical protein